MSDVRFCVSTCGHLPRYCTLRMHTTDQKTSIKLVRPMRLELMTPGLEGRDVHLDYSVFH